MKRLSSILLFCASLAHGANYYVNSTNGNNSNAGTSGSPFASLTKFSFGGTTLNPGDNVYCAGAVGTVNFLQGSGSSNAPITITNWGTATWGQANTPAAPALRLSGNSWIRVLGGYFTNIEYAVYGTSVTNCEFGGLSVSGCTRAFFISAQSGSNWYHNNNLTNAFPDTSSCNDGGSGLMWLGTYSGASDHSSFNVIESNYFTQFGHHGLSLSGLSNAVLNNTFCNPVWYQSLCGPQTVGSTALTNSVWGGGREVDSGGDLVGFNLYQSNHFSSSGFVPDCPGALQLEGEGNDVVRNNWFDQNAVQAISIYGNGQSVQQGSNAVYNNTIVASGFNYTFYTVDSSLVQVLYPEYQSPVFCFGTTNNVFLNNLAFNNYAVAWNMFPGGALLPAIVDFRGNLTNTDPLFVNGTANSLTTLNANPVVFPDLHLRAGSPAAGTGAFLTGITSGSGSGTSFAVTNAGVFFGGVTACTRTIPGDLITFQGNLTQQATVVGISGNTITVDHSVTWTQGQGVALANTFAGAAPDVGAFAYQAPTNATITVAGGLGGSVISGGLGGQVWTHP